jgi:hypothetical protein
MKLCILLLAFIKIWMVGGQTLCANGYFVHDDRLFLNIANSFLSGKWLGAYNNLILIKGPFYPIWIVIVFILGGPLLLAEHIIYIAACVMFIVAVRPVLPKPMLLLTGFVFLLFNPMSYTTDVMTRVLREGIYPALTLMTIASALGIFVRAAHPFKKVILWSISLGFVLSAFWLTREEGIWIAPFLIIILIFTALNIGKRTPNDWRRVLIISILPFFIWMLSLGSVALINKKYYGVFTTVEFKENDFLSAYGALSRVKQANHQLFVPVSREVRERIYQLSPAFTELRPFLEGDIGRRWTQFSCSQVSVCNDISAGFFMWALRDAVAAAGYYSSGKAATKYYSRMAVEINNACESKKLDCAGKRASMLPPWHTDYTKPLLNTILRAFISVCRFDGFNSSSGSSKGDEDSLLLFRDMTRERLSPLHIQQAHGWIIAPSRNIDLTMRTSNGSSMDAFIEYSKNYNNNGFSLSREGDNLNAHKRYFEITTGCAEGCYLHINKGDKLVAKLPLDGSIISLNKPEIHLQLDFVGHKEIHPIPPNQSKIDELKINVLNRIAKAYQQVMPFLMGGSLIAYFVSIINIFRRKNVSVLWIINTSLVITIFVRIFLLSLIEVTSFPAINTIYLSPIYPLLSIFPVLVFADLIGIDAIKLRIMLSPSTQKRKISS